MPETENICKRKHGQVWNSSQFRRDFEVIDADRLSVTVRRKSDGQVGSLKISEMVLRFYYDFSPS